MLKNINKKFAFILAISFTLGFITPSNNAIQVSNHSWGLSYQVDGEKPIPNLESDVLKKYNAYYASSRDEKNIYITFDAGFEAGYTEKILETLKKHDAKAIFFVVGSYIETNPEICKKIVADGHILGNHTYNHPNMQNLSKEEFTQELEKFEKAYKDVIGSPIQKKFYRPPEGKFSIENLEWANELGYTTMLWSLAYVDWYQDNQPTKEEAFTKLIPRIHNGAVVLLHSTSKTNADILEELIQKWKDLGYTIDEPDNIQ